MKKVFITALALLLCITTFAQRGNDSGQNARKNVSLVVTQPANLYGGMHNIPAIVSRTLGQRSSYFVETFDVDGLNNWTNLDEDGDGHMWLLAEGRTGMGAKSVSWESSYGAPNNQDAASRHEYQAQQKDNSRASYDPDNWLISPAITIPAGVVNPLELSWYVKGASSSFPEHYGVYVSTTGDQPADFTTQVYEGTSPVSWTQLTADLSAYIGQTVRVAFRHYNSYDKMNFIIDDIEIKEDIPVVCDPITVFPYTNDFENFLDDNDCWIDIDNDGDGYSWFTDTQAYGTYGWGVDGSNCLVSQSYDNNIGSRDADNYLLSPEFELPADGNITLSWYEQSQDDDYHDWYEVMIAPNGSTEISDFVSIYSGDAAYPWTERTADISAYAGTTVRVVFHHQSYDRYMLEIDNMSITLGGSPEPEGQLTIEPNPVDFGYRPNNCWMRPMVATVTNNGPATTIYGVDVDNNYFVPSLGEELAIPFALDHGESFNVNFGWTTAAEGEVNGVLAIDNQNRLANLFDITAYAYEPVEPDVWEMARVIRNAEDYRDNPTTVTLYNNYVLPPANVEDGNDAVYKMTIDHDMMLNGNVVKHEGVESAENGKLVVYTQAGIDAVGGPDLENNYTGPTINVDVPMEMTAFADGGTTTEYLPMYGLFADAYTRSQYVIPATEIAQMAGCPINSLTYYTASTPTPWQSNFQVYLTEVNYTTVSSLIDPATATTVYTGQLVVADGMMHIDFATPYQYNGGNLLIGMDCLERNNFSSCYFKAVAMTGAGRYYYNYSAPTFASSYAVNYAPTTTFGYMGRNANRDGNVLTYDFEDGTLQGWTSIDADGDYYDWYATSYYDANNGSYAVVSESYDDYFEEALYPDNYLVSPQVTLGEGASISFYEAAYYGWPEHVSFMVSTTGTNPSDFTEIQNWDFYNDHTSVGFAEQTVDLSAYAGQQVYLAFRHHNSSDNYAILIDDITIDLGGTPGPTPVPGDQLITNMTMLPGTYYIAASSTEDAWDVILNASELPCPDEITAEANLVAPLDDADGLEPAAVELKWHLSNYTTEYRLVFGSTYYCETVLVDWTRDLRESYTVRNLFNNTNYFWRIEERNDGCPQGIQGPVWGFTTTFNAPTNLHATNANGTHIYEGETLHLAWTPIVDRTFRMYNIYQNGDLIGQTPSNPDPNATTTFDVEGLEYNMGGYVFNVTALYDEGESGPSNPLVIYVSGEGNVEGYVYEQDGVTGIAGATVTMTGTDEFGRSHTYTFTTDANGYYTGAMYAGEYSGVATCAGYQDVAYENNPFEIIYDELTPDINFIMDEVFAPVAEVIAEYYPDPENPESPYVKVYWGWNIMSSMIEDFETGDFSQSQFEWNVSAQYPFEITTTNPYEGTYCMQSTNFGVQSSTSSIDVDVEIPRDGLMSFYKRISSENGWDFGYFYIDGVRIASFTGESAWGVKEVAVTEGVHNFKWAYEKDMSDVLGSGEDRFFIDYIDFIHDAQPLEPGWIYYDNGVNEDAIGLTGGGSFLWGVRFPASMMASFAGCNLTKVSLFDYEAHTGKVMIYQGGATAPGTLIHQQPYTCTGSNDFVETTLTSALSIDPTQDLWVVMNNDNGSYVAAMCDDTGDPNGRWISLDGSEWEDVTSYDLDATWMIRAYVSDGAKSRAISSDDAISAIKPEYTLSGASWSDLSFDPAQTEPVNVGTPGRSDRSFQYFRVYRTDCYNDGPYTPENTVVCCCELHDTLYIDVEWPELDPGVYKWGVGCVYGGNRGEEVESSIAWANVEVPASQDNAERRLKANHLPVICSNTEANDRNRDEYLQYCTDVYDSSIGTDGGEVWWGVRFPAAQLAAYNGQNLTKVGISSYYAGSYEAQVYVGGTTAPGTLVASATQTLGDDGAWYDIALTTPVTIDASNDLWLCFHTLNITYPMTSCPYNGNPDSDFLSLDGVVFEHTTDYGLDGTWMIRGLVEAGTPGPTPDPDPSEIQEPRESPIVWSNCLDKDMYINGGVDITVLLNSADSPEGVNVSFTNLNAGEQELYPIDPVVLDGTGYYAWDSFRRGDYVVSVTLDGYEPITDTVDLWEPYSMRYVMIEIIYGVKDLYVSHTGWAMWEPMGGGSQGGGADFEVDFEGGVIPEGWTTYEEGSSPYSAWTVATGGDNYGQLPPYAGNYAAYSDGASGGGSYYLVSPALNLAGTAHETLSLFYANPAWVGDVNALKVAYGPSATGPWTTIFTNTTGNSSWTNLTLDLSDACGGTVYVAFIDENNYGYGVSIDNLVFSSGRSDGERHLEGYKVLCTSIDGEPIFSGNTVNPFIQVDTDELVEGENYLCKVAAIYSTGMSDWSEVVWQYKSCDNYEPATDVDFEGQTVYWNYPGGPVPPPVGDTFTEGFESGSIPTGWTTIDADGDNHNWTPASVLMAGYLIPAHGGADCITSQSYDANTGAALHPDNYLVSPQVAIANGSTFSFWACAQDPSYAAEHYGVAISTTGNTNAADFTTIAEWTMSAKDAAEAGAYMSKNGRGTREGNWYQKTVDLSDYAGQQVYIAIRHFDCSDMFYLNVDDAELAINAKSGNRDVIVFNGYVTDPGAMANGADASWTKGAQTTWGPNVNNASGYWLADSFTLDAATTISEIEVYGYQTGSTTTSTFTGLYAQIYDGNPMNGANVVWGTTADNIMTATAFTNCYRGSNGESTATTRPIMSITAGNLNIELEAGTYYLAYSLTGTVSSGPWGAPHAEPVIGNTGAGVQNNGSWVALADGGSGETFGCAMKISGNGGTPVPPTPTGEVLGAMIFRDGEWLAEVPYPTNTYLDEEASGDHEYCVRVIYDGTADLPDQNEYYSMSCPVCTGVIPVECEPGAPIRGEYVWNSGDDFGALISWGEQAEPIAEWLYYDNGTNEDAIGLTGGGSFYWGIMIPATQLGAYAGCSLTKVSLFDYTAHTGKVIIYQGGSNAPGTPIHQQNYTMNGSNDYVEIALSTPLGIDPSQNLWIVFNNNDGDYVASCCANTGDANGRWISLDGASWEDVASYGLSNTWQIRAYVTNMAKGAAPKAIEAPALNGTANGILANAGVSKQGNRPAYTVRAAEIVRYNVYRSVNNVDYEYIGSVEAVEGQDYYEYFDATAAGTYYYQVRAEYENGCESRPAYNEFDGSLDYVIVIVTSVAENGEVALYPNPTNGNITIQAQNMNRITVVSALGQVVMDTEVDCSEYRINMAQFNAGVYMVRIATENGVSTQRVTVVK